MAESADTDPLRGHSTVCGRRAGTAEKAEETLRSEAAHAAQSPVERANPKPTYAYRTDTRQTGPYRSGRGERHTERLPDKVYQQSLHLDGPPSRPIFGQSGKWGHVYAAVDLGTNNCRLLIARPRRTGFQVMDAFSRTVCLGEGIASHGQLTQESMDRALDALSICVTKMRRRNVTVSRAIATQACRSASNGEDFADRIRRETGILMDIIPPAEEARLAATGCLPLVDRACETALVFDIGGGSTELVWLDLKRQRHHTGEPNIAAWTSIPSGVVTLTERFSSEPDTVETYRAMVAYVRDLLAGYTGADGLRSKFASGPVHLIGTSGTVTTLASVSLQLERYERDRVDGAWLDMDQIVGICHQVAAMGREDRHTHPCIGPGRADFVLAGCAILEAIHGLWPCRRLRVADRGLREGILLALMAGADRAGPGPRKRRGRAHRGPRPQTR